MPTVSVSKLYLLKELLALASAQLSDPVVDSDDVRFAQDNVESALDIVVDYIKTEEYDPSY